MSSIECDFASVVWGECPFEECAFEGGDLGFDGALVVSFFSGEIGTWGRMKAWGEDLLDTFDDEAPFGGWTWKLCEGEGGLCAPRIFLSVFFLKVQMERDVHTL